MKKLLKLEEVLMFALGVYLFAQLPYTWWLFPALILAPDIGMLGYLVNKRAGAHVYNFFHHKGLAILLYLAGSYLSLPLWQLAGIILFSHASLDRVFGYGLKYISGFTHTHLGEIGRHHE